MSNKEVAISSLAILNVTDLLILALFIHIYNSHGTSFHDVCSRCIALVCLFEQLVSGTRGTPAGGPRKRWNQMLDYLCSMPCLHYHTSDN